MMRLQLQALRNNFRLLPPLLLLIWKASPSFTLLLLFATLIKGILPIINIAISSALLAALMNILFAKQHVPILPDPVVVTVLAIGGVFLISQLLSNVQNAVQSLYQIKLQNYIRLMMAEKASSLDLPFFEDPEFHNKMSNATNEASYRPVMILTQSTSAISSLITLISMSAVIAFWHIWIIPILLCSSTLSFLVSAHYSKKKAKMTIERTPVSRKSQYFYSLITTDFFAKETRVFDLRDFFLLQYKQIMNDLYHQDQDLTLHQLLASSAVQILFAVIQTALSFYVIAQLLFHFISITQYSIYLQSISQLNTTFLALMVAAAQLYENQMFLSYLFDFLAIEPKIEKAHTPPHPQQDLPSATPCIEFRDVTFRYPDTEWNAIDHLTFTLQPGEVMALVGKNGAGKTTFVKLLAGLYQPTEGQILFDGVDIATLDRAQLRSHLGILFQDYPVYNLSAYQNIGIGKVDQVENYARIEDAARRSGFDAVIEDLPNKYNTILGRWIDRGHELSGGQRQLAGLARALMRQAPVLILDEPTSALDPHNEWHFFQHLLSEYHIQNQSIIFISHRFSTVRHADRIIVLEHGRKIEEGSHDELMQLKGNYAEMFTMQAQMYRETPPEDENLKIAGGKNIS